MSRPSERLRPLLPLLVLALLLTGLERWVASGAAPMTVPRPSVVGQLLWDEQAVLLRELGLTLLTAGYGLLLALLLALAVGFAAHALPRSETPVLTVGAVLSSVPMIALAPILGVWFGVGLATRVTITLLVCVFPLLVAVVQGLRESRAGEQELFTVLAATPWQRFCRLALPSAVPLLFVGLKIAAPLAVLGALIGEWNGAERGLGVLMLNAMFGLQVPRLWATVVVACGVSMALYGYLGLCERVAGYQRHGRAGAEA
jgi:ABC-type nitrate/sulfonate/bicarbonate transport system permease component